MILIYRFSPFFILEPAPKPAPEFFWRWAIHGHLMKGRKIYFDFGSALFGVYHVYQVYQTFNNGSGAENFMVHIPQKKKCTKVYQVYQTDGREKPMPQSQAERDRKRLDKLKESGGKNVLLRLHREETKALDFLCRYHGLNKGEVMAKLILEEHRRIAAILLSDPQALKKYTSKRL